MMRKAFALLISVVIALSLFTGCYSVRIRLVDKSQTTTETDSTEKTTQSETKSTQTESEVKKEAVPWSGKVATSYESGSGTSEDPYEIATAEQLALLAQQANEGKVYSGMYYYLSNDIYLNSSSNVELMAEIVASAYEEYSKDSENIRATTSELGVGIIEYLIDLEDYNFNEWTPIGAYKESFKGCFDGNGYTIYGMYVPQGNYYYDYGYKFFEGLFGYVENGTISNVKIDSAIIIGHRNGSNTNYLSYCGGIVGRIYEGTVEECSASNVWVESQNYSGGIAGLISTSENNNIEVRNCVTHSNCYIVDWGSFCSGGIVGVASNYSKVIRCINYGFAVCGIFGDSSKSCTISYCVNLGDTSRYAIGRIDSTSKVTACYFANTSSVNGSDETSSGISATSEDNLRTYYWLVDKFALDENTWYMSDGEMYLK